MTAGTGFILDFNNNLKNNKRLRKKVVFDKKKTSLAGFGKIPKEVRQNIRKENKRSNLIRAIITIFVLVTFVAFIGMIVLM